MAFSMHSHSGQFCPGHAKDSLEEVVQTAISKGMQTFALTEHMPRTSDEDRYPEEVSPHPFLFENPSNELHRLQLVKACPVSYHFMKPSS